MGGNAQETNDGDKTEREITTDDAEYLYRHNTSEAGNVIKNKSENENDVTGSDKDCYRSTNIPSEKDSLFEESEMSLRTINAVAQGHINADGIFKAELKKDIETVLLPYNWQQAVVGEVNRRLNQDGLNSLCRELKKMNDYCCFRFRTNRIKKTGSRKENSPFWKGIKECSFTSCRSSASLSIMNENSTYMKAEWNGNILHSVAEMKSRKLRGKECTEFGKRLVHEAPSKICRQNLATLSSEAYSS